MLKMPGKRWRRFRCHRPRPSGNEISYPTHGRLPSVKGQPRFFRNVISFADKPTIGAMVDGNSSLSGSIVGLLFISVLWLKSDARRNWGNPDVRRRQLILIPVLRMIVLGLIDERLGLLFRLHVGADGGLQALDQIRLFGLLKPGFDLCVITVLLLLVPHFAKQKLSFELFAWQFLDELHQAGFRLHKGFEPGIDFGVEFKLADQFFFSFW